MLDPSPATGKLLHPGEAAERLAVSARTVRRLVSLGCLTEVRVSDRSPRITERSVERHIAARTSGSREGVSAA